MKQFTDLMYHFFSCFRLTPLTNQLRDYIEGQLKIKHTDLVQWFTGSEIPRLEGYFIPLLKKWSIEYAGRFVQSSFSVALY